MTEPDYAIFLIRAETALKAVFPAMSERRHAEGLRHALEVQRQLTEFHDWVIRANTKR